MDQAPAITSATSATFTVGMAGSFTVTSTGYPTPMLSESGTLPGGVTFNAATSVLSGTPATATAGSYNISFTAANGVGSNATQSFTLTVDSLAPTITSLSPPSATAGSGAQTLTINGTNFLSSSTVTYNGVAHTPTFVSSIQLDHLPHRQRTCHRWHFSCSRDKPCAGRPAFRTRSISM